MGEKPESDRDEDDLRFSGAGMTAPDLEAWFVREILPLEASLMQFLRHNWRDRSEVEDLRQEVYVRVCEAAEKDRPKAARSFMFAIARNLLIDLIRKRQIVPIEAVTDLEFLNVVLDAPTPDRSAIAKDELRRLQNALDQLPPRHRQAVVLGRIEGLSGREIAARMGIAESTASDHLKLGMHALTDLYLRETTDIRRRT